MESRVVETKPQTYWIKHIDTDADVVRFYGPTNKADAEKRVENIVRCGHKAEVIRGRKTDCLKMG